MIEKVKQAIDSLLTKKEITEDEHKELEKTAFKILKILKKWPDYSIRVPKSSAKISEMFKRYVVAPAIGGAAIMAGKELVVDPLVEANRIKKSFEAMTEKVPQLAEQDQETLRDYFNVVKTYSPKAASNPLVAGSLVNKMIQFGGVDHKLVQDIGAIQAGVSPPKVVPTVLETAARTVASPSQIKES